MDSYVSSLEEVDLEKLNLLLTEREKQCQALLKSAGVKDRDVRIERMADISFEGQGFPLTVPIPSGKLKPNHMEIIEEFFRNQYVEAHGRAIEDVPLRVFNWPSLRCRAFPKSKFQICELSLEGKRKCPEGFAKNIFARNKRVPEGQRLQPLPSPTHPETEGTGVGRRA